MNRRSAKYLAMQSCVDGMVRRAVPPDAQLVCYEINGNFIDVNYTQHGCRISTCITAAKPRKLKAVWQ